MAKLENQLNATYEKYLEIKKNTDNRIEFIDDIVYMSPSPSTKHQIVSANLFDEFRHFFKNTNCLVLAAPFDVYLQSENEEKPKVVIPDITVMCDKTGLKDNGYFGVPSIIIEILSTSNNENKSRDTVVKFNLYAKYGVREYWIVDPKEEIITIYELIDKHYYKTYITAIGGEVNSSLFSDLKINFNDIF